MGNMQMSQIIINEEVSEALEEGRGVVALESAVMTHGLPRTPLGTIPSYLSADEAHDDITRNRPDWNPDGPIHIQVVQQMSAAIHETGAVPAVTSIIDGKLHVGLENFQLERLAQEDHVLKISIADLAPAMVGGLTGGTTVAGGIAISTIADSRIRVFATGGIGGVHRDWTSHPDVSADLEALARTPIAVICSGAKVILDVPATFERLGKCFSAEPCLN